MWSDRYNYYNIQSDLSYSGRIEIERIVSILLETACFVQKDHQSFCNSDSFPWLELTLTNSDNGNFASSDRRIKYINLISIVCLKGKDIDTKLYTDVFGIIANSLSWKLYLEEDDDGNENIEIKIA